MAQSFTIRSGQLEASPKRRTVLVTGAAGNIGRYFATHSYKRYALRMMVHHADASSHVQQLSKLGQVVPGDISDLKCMMRLCEGIDTVLHLAGDPSPSATWESLLPSNIVGTYNTYVAAKAAGCRRVIYASSIHAISGYPPDVQVKSSDPVNPGDLYGVSKCFGEALGRYMAEKEGVSSIALRIGAFQPPKSAKSDGGLWMLDAWVSQRDLNQLIEKCIDDEKLTFAIFNGLSDNRFKRMDISDARELVGYDPHDDLTRINPKIKKLDLDDSVVANSLIDSGQKSGIRDDLPERGEMPAPIPAPARRSARGRAARKSVRRSKS